MLVLVPFVARLIPNKADDVHQIIDPQKMSDEDIESLGDISNNKTNLGDGQFHKTPDSTENKHINPFKIMYTLLKNKVSYTTQSFFSRNG